MASIVSEAPCFFSLGGWNESLQLSIDTEIEIAKSTNSQCVQPPIQESLSTNNNIGDMNPDVEDGESRVDFLPTQTSEVIADSHFEPSNPSYRCIRSSYW